jgi:hypothetical protein
MASAYADKFKGVSYVDVVDHLIRLKTAQPVAGRCDLCIGGMSIGRVVTDKLAYEPWRENHVEQISKNIRID